MTATVNALTEKLATHDGDFVSDTSPGLAVLVERSPRSQLSAPINVHCCDQVFDNLMSKPVNLSTALSIVCHVYGVDAIPARAHEAHKEVLYS